MTLLDRYSLLNLEHGYWLDEWSKADDAGDTTRAELCLGHVLAISMMIDAIDDVLNEDDDDTDDGLSAELSRTRTSHGCGCGIISLDIGDAGNSADGGTQA